jgi:hypothetical protein
MSVERPLPAAATRCYTPPRRGRVAVAFFAPGGMRRAFHEPISRG